jgi:hypothetical protein
LRPRRATAIANVIATATVTRLRPRQTDLRVGAGFREQVATGSFGAGAAGFDECTADH